MSFGSVNACVCSPKFHNTIATVCTTCKRYATTTTTTTTTTTKLQLFVLMISSNIPHNKRFYTFLHKSRSYHIAVAREKSNKTYRIQVSPAYSYSYSSPATCNSIPTSIKNCSSLYSFKHHLKSHLIAHLINN